MPVITPEERLRRHIDSKVRRFIAENDLWPVDGRMLVAVSGGPDSTALLLVLSRLARQEGVELVAAYFDHGLRGELAATAEHKAVEKLSAMLEVPLLTGAGDVRAEAKRRKTSLEAAARRLRYDFLARAAAESGCSAVATGHTLEDQAETVLLHVLRGAGLKGLAGIASRSAWPFAGNESLALVRTLLCLRRDETLAYCVAAGIEPIHDESNDSLAYERNRLRQELMPALRRFNPRVEEALARLADAAREHKGDAPPQFTVGSGEVVIERSRLRDTAPASRHEALAGAIESLLGDREGLSARHYGALDRLLVRGHTGDRLDLSRGIVAELTRDALALRLGAVEVEALPDCGVTLSVPGEARFGPLLVAAGPSASDDDIASVVLDAASVGERIIVRRRREGDRMQPAGMTGRKKLQDLFVDAHVPRAQRDTIPVFENERGVVWVGGLRIADWAKAHDGRPTVTLSYRRA